MRRSRIWGSAMVIVIALAVVMPYWCLWPWSQQYTMDIATVVILAITAWAVIIYAKDTHTQTRNLSRRHIQPSLSEEAPTWSPRLSTNTIFSINSPDGSVVNAKVKLLLWVGEHKVLYDFQVDQSGLHKGKRLWAMNGGQFRGVVEPGPSLDQFIQQHYSGTLTFGDLFDPQNAQVPHELKSLPQNKKIRAQLLVRYPEYVSGQTQPEDRWGDPTSSYIYYLEPAGLLRTVNGQQQLGYFWIPHPDDEDIPPGAKQW